MTPLVETTTAPMGVLLHLPKRTCVGCTHFATPEDDAGMLTSHCTLWNEPLDDETVAADCPDFDRDEDQE